MNNNSDIVISTNNLSKVYKLYKNPKDRLKEALSFSGKIYHKDFYALKNINLEIRRGEVIGIVGKNGSGKSTLLKILSRVLTPTSGEFMVKGKVSSLLELGSGFNPELTGIENIFFYATILGIEEKKIKEKLQEILDFADIGDFVYQPLKTYSSGMKARLAFSVAINVDPDILILDEVLAVGDTLFRRKCYAKMESFFKGHKTILFVSHATSDVNQLCTRAILLDHGESILEGPSKFVTTQYEKYLFSSSVDKNILRNEIILLNNNNIKKETNCIINSGTLELESIPRIINEDKPINANIKTSIKLNQKPYFIKNLIPKSTQIYKNADVDLSGFCIKTLSGELVNALVTGDRYIYCFKVNFNIDLNNVCFGLMIKTEKGQKLLGVNDFLIYPELRNIEKESVFEVAFEFDCNLFHGNYYTNAGVFMLNNDERILLCRVIDSLIFRVQHNEKEIFGGIVSMNHKLEISKLK